jgi:hypothetical protein
MNVLDETPVDTPDTSNDAATSASTLSAEQELADLQYSLAMKDAK